MITSTSVRQGGAHCCTLLAVPGPCMLPKWPGSRWPTSIKVGGSELVLNGAGLRSKLFIKVYVGALYVGQKAATLGRHLRQPAAAPHGPCA